MSPFRRFKRLDALDKSVVRLAGIAAAALVAVVLMAGVVVAVVLSYGSNGTSHEAVVTAQADCETWHDLSTIIPADGTKPSGLQLYADFRKSYTRKGCDKLFGKLPPADPRLDQYLPPELR